MIIGLPVWTAALDIANSSLAKKVPYSIAFASEHMATDPISVVEQLKDISSISTDIDFDETLDKLHRCNLEVNLGKFRRRTPLQKSPSKRPVLRTCTSSRI